MTIVKNGEGKVESFSFIDLFAGIGGFHQAFGSLGGECVLASDWNKYSRQTYEANYRMEPYGDIKDITEHNFPVADVVCGGFPCQPFSIAGVSKKNSMGIPHGFDDEKQGTCFLRLYVSSTFPAPK